MESNNRKQSNAVVVVEGWDDTKRLEQFSLGIETIEISGSEVSGQALAGTRKPAKIREIITFTDPGYNGEGIRRLVTNAVSNTKQAFITHKGGESTKRRNSLGVEYVSKEVLVRALGDLHEIQAVESDIIKEKYGDLGPAVSPEIRLPREKVRTKLGIGYGNSKQFLKCLKIFGIAYDEPRRATENVR